MALHFLSPSSVDFAKQLAARFDVIIIGAGSTGSVMAARLSENPNCRVLLVEAGPAQLNAEMLAATRNANQPAVLHGLNWKIRTQIKAPANSVPNIVGAQSRSVASIFDYEAGKVLGGSSAVNATQALRGCPSDYDEWIAECGEEWGWKAVLPFFRRLENDTLAHTDGEDANALHGHDGPFPIRRESQQELTPLQEGLRLACLSKGFSETHDHNNPATTGVGIIPKNVIDGIRMSVAQTYLSLTVDRANLFVLTDATAHRLHWTFHDSTRCDGVELEIDAAMHTVLADKVIVCAGVMQTPGLLMRSGIGAPPLLQKLDISVRSPLSGVGENFMEHPVVGIWGIPKAGESRLGEPLRQTLLRYSSGHSAHQNDMHICMMAGIDVAAMFPHLASEAKTIAGLTACFNKSKSRGYVRITSADAHAKPLVVNNCLGDASDITPLKHGVRLAWDLLQTPALAGKFEKILAWTEGMIKSDIALERAVTTFVRPAAHGCGSAKMGLHPDHGAVLDPQGRVYGIQNLWVADASAIPLIPSAPPHLTALMLAEKLAHQFCKEFR